MITKGQQIRAGETFGFFVIWVPYLILFILHRIYHNADPSLHALAGLTLDVMGGSIFLLRRQWKLTLRIRKLEGEEVEPGSEFFENRRFYD